MFLNKTWLNENNSATVIIVSATQTSFLQVRLEHIKKQEEWALYTKMATTTKSCHMAYQTFDCLNICKTITNQPITIYKI